MSRSRSGLTLVELLAVLAILAALAAVLYPAVAVQIRKGQSTAVADQLNNLRDAIINYQGNVARYPTVLTQLTVQPIAGETDLCGTALPAANRNAWRGPYLAQNIVGNMPVGDATVQNDITRNPLTNGAGPTGILQIVVAGVDPTSATDLEQQFDGNNNFLTGSILWVAVGSSGTLTFQIPIRNC